MVQVFRALPLLQAYPAQQLAAMCREQFYPNVRECLKVEQPCLNACNGRGLCVFGVCKCPPGEGA